VAELPPPPDTKGGWYPDPEGSGRLRWWGGKKWSDRFQDAPGGAASKPSSTPAAASPAAEKATKQRGRWLGVPWWAWLIGAFVVLGIVGAITGGNKSSNDSGSHNTAAQTPITKTVTQAETVTQAATPTTTAAAPTATTAATPTPSNMTAGQANALRSAQQYLSISGFSRAGLIQQLSSSAGEGFSKADATFAADHVGANWNEEAVRSAQDYLKTGPFSRQSLYEQLSSSAGEGFTPAQARYAVNQVYGH